MIHQALSPCGVDWLSPDTPTCIVIHGGQFTGRVHPPNQFVPEMSVLCLVPRTCLSYITDCLFFQRTYFFHRLP